VFDRFLLLPLGAAIALVWANLEGESYFRFAHALAFPVNQIGMALFLALVAQEVLEAVMRGGALHTWRRWGLPVAGALGGAAGAAVVYVGYIRFSYQPVLYPAWPVVIAIDLAAAYYVLKLIAPRRAALPFLLVLAVVTDALALLIVAVGPPLAVGGQGLLLILAALALAAAFRRLDVRAFWPYLGLCGVLSWAGFYLAGLHPALALVPLVPFLPREPRPMDLFAEPPDDDAVHHAEHEWNEAVQVVLFFFGLVNAGVLMRGYYTGTWAVLAAALVGRPLGILAGLALGRAAGLHLPRRITWKTLAVVAFATSSGFTFALFFAATVIPVGPVLSQIKIGALLSVLGAAAAFGAARLLHVGRFAGHADRRGGR
jgi:NhaA family Na+:H+ antiporter